MSEIEVGPQGAVLINETDFEDDQIISALREQRPDLYQVTKQLSSWATYNMGSRTPARSGSIFDRDRWVTPEAIFDKFTMAADAVRSDDVVGGVCETTEQLAVRKVNFSSASYDEESIWNQIAEDINLSDRMREIWRELFSISQCYVAVQWGRKTYKVEGKPGLHQRKRRKTYQSLWVPLAISILDPLKILPVGNFMFGQERLVYIASPSESAMLDDVLASENSSDLDLIVSSLIEEEYVPDRKELANLRALTGDKSIKKFYLLKKDSVFRITSTRPAYQRFADVRIESVFELLDLKQQLRQMDRASLMGSINAIVLVKKGSDAWPAKPNEVAALTAQVAGNSQRPIIVSDHRLEVEIVTPKTDKTLAAERHNAIDSRLTSRLYQLFSSGNYASGTATDSSINLMKVVASSMEARRDGIRDSLMRNIFIPMWRQNDKLEERPQLAFYPSRIALDFDAAFSNMLQTLRDRGDISRETILSEVGVNVDEEVIRRERESEFYDDIFTPPGNVPYDGDHVGPGGVNDNRRAGRTGGGNNNGGGTNKTSFEPTNTREGR